MRIVFTARAAREARTHDRWWRENRSAAPLLFEDELRVAIEQIRGAPALGTLFKSRRSEREYRRVLMPRTRYHVYYSVEADDRVVVHAIWSGLRGKGPAL